MNQHELTRFIQRIVDKAVTLKNKHTAELSAPVNYACIFSQSAEEYASGLKTARQMGKAVKETETGMVFQLAPIETFAGALRVVKIRKPDPTRPERGDADFTVADFGAFKEKYVGQPGFRLITRPEMEIIELVDPKIDVRAYFSHPTLAEILGIK